MEAPKQIIVMRKDLNMRKGKMIAQGAHASLKVILDNQKIPWKALNQWLSGSFTKICVQVKTEEELLSIVNSAKKAGLHHSLILDNGATEFKGIPTYTCAAIGPEFPQQLDPVTGHLKLL